jgi:hypothetical protein
MPAQTVIKLRRDTAANWATADSVLASGEIAFESDTNKIKVGDGSTAWSLLDYASGAGTAAEVTSDTTNFAGLLSAADSNVQAALDTLDNFEIPPGTTASDTPPAGPEVGQLWWDSTDGTLYIYYDGFWVQAVTSVTGADGSDGTNGTNGSDGADSTVAGPTGPTGAPGPTGAAGDAAFHPFLIGF